MIKTVLIGFGNVGSHLARAFEASSEIDLIQIYNRTYLDEANQREVQANFITDLKLLKKAEVYVVAVKDDCISDLINSLPSQNAIVAHTSGSVQLLETQHRDAVFYPLQTFSKNKALDYSNIPFCLEAKHPDTYAVIEKMAKSISTKVHAITTLQRQQLHLSAVFVCNFVNHLYAIGEDICLKHQIPFEILDALIDETAQKIKTLSPTHAQTGPALRNDQKTIQRHLSQLEETNYKVLYQQLTNSIALKHGKKL